MSAGTGPAKLLPDRSRAPVMLAQSRRPRGTGLEPQPAEAQRPDLGLVGGPALHAGESAYVTLCSVVEIPRGCQCAAGIYHGSQEALEAADVGLVAGAGARR
ncbi:hypothetical protein ZWY2020_027818 [Hordeum vulgare]|nr:hypothetical protein ZWY2020_027818 [Hordeum vulgare]